jgi:hypothetical protein
MELQTATSKTCRSCIETNLIEDVRIQRCKQCQFLYCVHFSSNIDPQYCTECLSDVSMLKEVVTKTYQYYNEETDTVTEYRRKARSIRLEGADWLFRQRKIVSMSDESLELAIEYHREILSGMLKEREERRIKHAHRYAGIKEGTETVGIKDSANVTATSVKRTKTIQSSKAQATANGALQAMMAQGMSIDKILEVLQKAASGVK